MENKQQKIINALNCIEAREAGALEALDTLSEEVASYIESVKPTLLLEATIAELRSELTAMREENAELRAMIEEDPDRPNEVPTTTV